MPSSVPAPLLSHRASSSSSRRRSGPSGEAKVPAPTPALPATLSSALTEERLREFNRRNRSERLRFRNLASSSDRALRGLSPGRESCYDAASATARRFREWGSACFSMRRGRDVWHGRGDGREKVSAGGGGAAEFRVSKVGARSSPMRQLDGRALRDRAPAEAVAARPEAKPLNERVLAKEDVAGDPVVRGGRKPTRESTSAPLISIREHRRAEKASSRRSGSAEGALGPPPLPSCFAPAPPWRREPRGAGSGSGRGTTKAVTQTTSGGVGKERAFVWADKYRPRALEEFICNRPMVAKLLEMVHEGECDHFIFEGPPGVGKKTMISALLREVFGAEKTEPKDDVRVFYLKGENVPKIEANVKISSRHVEVNLSDLCGYEKHAVVSLIKESPRSVSQNTMQCDHTNCKAIVLYEADKLSTDSQHYIRWLMEKYKACFKIIFCCSDSSKLQPVKQLCTVVKLHPPSQSEIVEVLEYIAKNEDIDLPCNVAKKIADNAKQNLRQAIRSFEASWQSSYPFKEDQEILTGWEEDIANIAKNIVDEQSPRQLYSIREKLKNLIEHNVSPQFIFTTLQLELKKHLDDDYHTKLDDICEEYKKDILRILDSQKSLIRSQSAQENSNKGNDDMRSFMTIEEFTAKFMSFYKSNVVKNVEGTG